MGAGTERRQKLVLPQLLQYRETLLEAKRRGAVLLFTGNAFELLGSAVTDAEGKRYDCLGFAGFESNETKRRITGDVIARIGDERVVGFMNKCGHTTGVKQPLFHVEFGFGNEEACGDEGWRDGNCFGTHLTSRCSSKIRPCSDAWPRRCWATRSPTPCSIRICSAAMR